MAGQGGAPRGVPSPGGAARAGRGDAALGVAALYYERGGPGLDERPRPGRRAYVAPARVAEIRPDPRDRDRFYALIEPGSFVVFDRPVPFREGEFYYERQLRR